MREFKVTLLIALFFLPGNSFAQLEKFKPLDFELKYSRMLSNAITDIVVHDNEIWLGTGKGLSVTKDDGKSFITYYSTTGIGKGSVSALAVDNGTIWVATGFDTTTSEGDLPAGSGLSYSSDGGESWNHIPQPKDSRDEDRYSPTTTNVNNLTYDIAFEGNNVWIVSFGGGMRKSSDYGQTWEMVTPDEHTFEPLTYLNHRTFSVLSAENGLWVGTAGGINKSTDGGLTWTNYTSGNGNGISGNFVVAIAEQKLPEKSVIWAATWKAEGEEEYFGVSKTENGGLTWETSLHGEQVHNFGFNGEEVYVVSDNGLWKSVDFGKTWGLYPQIIDDMGDERVYTEEYYAVGHKDGALWVGTGDGLAYSTDNGYTWKIHRSFYKPNDAAKLFTYAYPNPFSPLRHNRIGEDGHVRIQYNTIKDTYITISIYDFSMKLVKTIVRDKYRKGGDCYSEVWDGKNESGNMVANGVYFYKLVKEGEKPLHGKIVVLN